MGPDVIFVEDQPYADGQRPPRRLSQLISPGYTEALGTRLIAGRSLERADIDQGRSVALISESLSRELSGNPDAAIGKRIRGASDAPEAWREIIGVTQDVHNEGLYEVAPSVVYWPVESRFELRGVTHQ